MQRTIRAALFAIPLLAMAQPWPLIRIRQTEGLNSGSVLTAAPPESGIQIVSLNSITGKPETWQVETHLSFAGMEEFDMLRGPRTERTHTLVLVYRHWWSHRPDEALQALRKARYVQVSTFQVGLGSEADFSKLLTARKAQLDGINLDRPDLAYQVIFGAPTGTVLLLSPLTSLKALDEGVSRSSSAYLRSTGTPSPRNSPLPGPTDLLQENILFRISPGYSTVSNEFAEGDPVFWRRGQ